MLRRLSAIIGILLCGGLLLFPLSNALVYAVTASATVNGSDMTVSGQAAAGERVSVIVERSDGKRSYLGQATAASNGNYSLSFGLGQGTYQATVSAGGQQAQTGQQTVTQDPVNNNPGGNGGSIIAAPDSNAAQAIISIKGDSANGVMLTATVWQWTGTCTVLQALKGVLDSQGLNYQLGAGGYVAGIGNLTEKKPGYPLSGWLFRVNGTFPPSGAESTFIKKGDKVEWLYTLDGGKDLDATEIKPEMIPVLDEQISQQIREMLGSYDTVLTGIKGCQVMNTGQPMTKAEAQALQQKLAGNQVVFQMAVTKQGGPVADAQQEIMLLFPRNAFDTETTVGVQELKADSNPSDTIWKPYSSIYQLQPDGSKFANPVRISIKLPIFPDMKAENLTPAWYNAGIKQWEALPGIIDMKNGMAVFDTTHFSNFAVLQKAAAPSAAKLEVVTSSGNIYDYTDVEKDYPWALTAIKALSSQGIMVGSNRGFEPGRVITRAELAALMQRSLEAKITGPDLELRDVPDGAWYYSVMQIAVKAGWINGYPDKTYHPDAVVNRYEAAGMLYNALNQSKPGSGAGEPDYSDFGKAPTWVKPALGYVADQGLMRGFPDGSFGGSQPMNRAQAAVIIWGIVNDR